MRIEVQGSRNEDLRHSGLKGLGFQDLRISGKMIIDFLRVKDCRLWIKDFGVRIEH